MKLDRIQPLIPQVAEILGISETQVAKVVTHQFSSLKEHLMDPPEVVTVQLDFLGKFRANLNAVNKQIEKVISYLRKDRDNEDLKKKLRRYWKIRRFLQKEKERRNFKKRFNGWYY